MSQGGALGHEGVFIGLWLGARWGSEDGLWMVGSEDGEDDSCVMGRRWVRGWCVDGRVDWGSAEHRLRRKE